MAIKKYIFKIIVMILETLSRMPWLGKRLYSLSIVYDDLYRNYSYEFEKNGELALIQILPTIFKNRQPLIFDVGANKGDWTNFVKQTMPDAEVHCFEMSPQTFMNLSENLSRYSNIFLNGFGLSDQVNETIFRDYGENNGGNTLIQDPCFVHRGEVRHSRAVLSTGERYMEEKGIHHVDFLKVDVEGWELFVMKGFGAFLDPEIISIVQFEYGYTHGDVHTLMKDFYTLLSSKGYVIGRLRQSGVEFMPFRYSLNDFKSGPNFVACHPQFASVLLKFGH